MTNKAYRFLLRAGIHFLISPGLTGSGVMAVEAQLPTFQNLPMWQTHLAIPFQCIPSIAAQEGLDIMDM